MFAVYPTRKLAVLSIPTTEPVAPRLPSESKDMCVCRTTNVRTDMCMDLRTHFRCLQGQPTLNLHVKLNLLLQSVKTEEVRIAFKFMLSLLCA